MARVPPASTPAPPLLTPSSVPGVEMDDAPESSGLRVSQACHACRRKKVKCDGKTPCHNCSSRSQSCDYPGSRDNGSSGRQYAMSLDARAQHMDALCHKLEFLVDRLTQVTPETDGANQDLVEAAQVLGSMPHHRSVDSEDTLDEEDDDEGEGDGFQDEPPGRAGAMVRDSYGHLRFLGGATNNMLIEAVKSLSPNTVTTRPQGTDVELPLFTRGQVWPQLPYLPTPDQLSRPPQYVADLLVKLYFDQLHYTFPVVFKPHFKQRYRALYRNGSGGSDRRFLLVFFAVCACASSLFPSTSNARFPGLEYYEKALLLYYASTGEASLEKVQCLALLAVCSAGWNTITQSWILAGQAVRASEDIGLHLSSRLVATVSGTTTPEGSDILRQQVSQRIWWSIYSVDRVTSICLGRPSAVQDEDCYCELPLDMNDEDLESTSRRQPFKPTSPQTTGFLAFVRLCRIAGKIQQIHSPRTVRRLANAGPEKLERFTNRVLAHDRLLKTWLDGLPDDIRFSANTAEWDLDGSPHLTMCVIMFIVHAGSLLNLYRGLIGNPKLADAAKNMDAVSQCVSAARSCINAAELVRDLVQPSHYLAICVHYLTLSGITLLRMPSSQSEDQTADVDKCVSFLTDLEARWSGASRSKAIIQHLVAERDKAKEAEAGSGNGNGKRPFAALEADQDEGLLWQMGSEVFGLGFGLEQGAYPWEDPSPIS